MRSTFQSTNFSAIMQIKNCTHNTLFKNICWLKLVSIENSIFVFVNCKRISDLMCAQITQPQWLWDVIVIRVFSKLYVLWGLCPHSIFTIFSMFSRSGLRQSLIFGVFYNIKFAPLRENTPSQNGKNSKNWIRAQTSKY